MHRPAFPSLAGAMLLALAACANTPSAPEAQEALPRASDIATPPSSPALTEEALETLELLRSAMREMGPEAARELLHDIVGDLGKPRPGGESAYIAYLLELDALAEDLGSLEMSRLLREGVLAAHVGVSPPDHPDLLAAKQNLAKTLYELGDLQGAHELFEGIFAARSRLLPADHPDLLTAKQSLAVTRQDLGDLEGARELAEEVLAARSRLLPADDPDLLAAKQNLATVRYELGDLEGAREFFEEILTARSRLFPADHPDLLDAKQNLAAVLCVLGDLQGALELEEELLVTRLRLLPADHPDLLAAKQNLAVTRTELGDIKGAHKLFEEILASNLRLLPADHPDLLDAKHNLALTRGELGDLQGARELEEEVHAARSRLLPADHPDLLAAKQNLAVTRGDLGDVNGQRELVEEVFAAHSRLLPADHPDLLDAKQNLAEVRYHNGDQEGARTLEEEILTARSRLLPGDHPDLLTAKQNLAVTLQSLGDIQGARQLEEEVLAARSRLFYPDHPDLLKAKQNLASTRYELGDLEGARELFEEVLLGSSRVLPADHPNLLQAKQNLAVMRTELGDLQGARELVRSLLAGIRARASALGSESIRFAREGASVELNRLSRALSVSSTADPEHTLGPELFATLESLRIISVAGAQVADVLAERPELDELARAAREKRALLSDLAAAAPEEDEDVEDWRRSIFGLAEERDQAERELRKRLDVTGAFVGELDAHSVSASLEPDVAIVSFLRYTRRFEMAPEMDEPTVDSLLVFVVQADASVRRVELGPAEELEALVSDWRSALGRPLEARGGGRWEAPEAPADLDAIGERLRERILDPVLSLAPDARTLHLVLDDLLHLVPLDALPLEGGLVGERFELRSHTTLIDFLHERPGSTAGGLLAVGGIDYEAELGDAASIRLDAATPALEPDSSRSGATRAGFLPLAQTDGEVTAVAALYEQALEQEATILSGNGATKAALLREAPRARFLHLATHGWFASESFKSQLDSLAEAGPRESFQRAEEALIGFAPETLCGIALAGANRGKDELGRVPGILTAEELAAFDLRNCELAVLSACETNVGIRRAGQGIQSLQTALHAAGARTAITSLWKVDDAATRRLFEIFYTKLWQEGLGKAEALWQAKLALRAEGRPLRDWAGWMLSGQAD